MGKSEKKKIEDEDNWWKVFLDFVVTLKIIILAFFWTSYRKLIPGKKKSVKNNIVLITGAGGGLGRHLACEFYQLGAVVILLDKNATSLRDTEKHIGQNTKQNASRNLIGEVNGSVLNTDNYEGSRVHSFVCDVGVKDQVYKTGKLVQERIGDVDILINNAAIVNGKSLMDTPDEKIVEIFNVNLLAHFWTVKCFLPVMLRRNRGHIVSIASCLGFAPINKLVDYSATKFGVMGFSEVLNYENQFSDHDNVKVTVVCPSFIKTDMFRGCHQKFPLLLPELEIKDTVDRIIQGILREEDYIYIPSRLLLVPVIKAMLPHDAWMAVMKLLGGDTFMDKFEAKIEKHS